MVTIMVRWWWRCSDCPIGGSHCPAITHGSCDLLSTGAPKAWSPSHLTSLLLKIPLAIPYITGLHIYTAYAKSTDVSTCTFEVKPSSHSVLHTKCNRCRWQARWSEDWHRSWFPPYYETFPLAVSFVRPLWTNIFWGPFYSGSTN